VNTSGIISTVAGNGTAGFGGDGYAATTAMLDTPGNIAVDASGNLYIADLHNQRIRMVNTAGIIATVAGNGTSGFSGDGAAATAAQLNYPKAVAVDGLGNIFISDGDNSRVRKVNTAGIITTVAGNGAPYVPGVPIPGDGGPATAANLQLLEGIATDASGNLYISSGYGVRKINSSGIITTIAGINDSFGYRGDGGPATVALLSESRGVAMDGLGDIFIADGANYRIRKIAAAISGSKLTVSEHNDIKLYPNPNRGSFTVTGSFNSADGENVMFEIMDVTVQTIYQSNVSTKNGKINKQIAPGNIARGLYLLSITSGTQHCMLRFVIDK
jgi:trimeric autotransporter adhesin